MKKKIIVGFVWFATMILITACISCCCCGWYSKETHLSRSLVTVYFKPAEFVVGKMSNNKIVVAFTEIEPIGGYGYTSSTKYAYDRICEIHNDMSYNREIRIENRTGIGIPPNQLVYADLTSIEIVSDTEWNAEHPAGSSLGDITMFYSSSPKKYIDSEYKDTYDWTSHTPIWTGAVDYPGEYQYGISKDKSPYHPVEKMISELKLQDMIMLGDGHQLNSDSFADIALLEFTSLPVENKEHNITVTLTTDEGETFSATINMVFE